MYLLCQKKLFWSLNMFLDIELNHQIYFLLVILFYTITIKCDIGDAFAILIHSRTKMTVSYTFRDQNYCLLIFLVDR
jgi:hypothetical protein